jgi:hypothetical protein
MIDTFIIPQKDAIIALDLASASIRTELDEGITLTDTDSYLRLKNIYTFNMINSKFADLVLQSAKAEGIRKMMTKQPIHVRHLSSTSNSSNLSQFTK